MSQSKSMNYNYLKDIGLIVGIDSFFKIKTWNGILFLDRDGVVIEDCHYIKCPDAVKLIPGAASTIKLAAELGWATVIVTNQSGIARGYFGIKEYEAVSTQMQHLLANEDAYLDLILACPQFSESHLSIFQHSAHLMRKPAPGMLMYAASKLCSSLLSSIIIGDKLCDMKAGNACSVAKLIHVLTGHGHAQRHDVSILSTSLPNPIQMVHSIADLSLSDFRGF